MALLEHRLQGEDGMIREALHEPGDERPGIWSELESWRANEPYGLLSSSSHMARAAVEKQAGREGYNDDHVRRRKYVYARRPQQW